eukprot:Em0021g555a
MAERSLCEYLFNLFVVGDSGCGKTQIIDRYLGDSFHSEYSPTMGIDFRFKVIDVEGRKINIQIWDTTGDVKYRTVTTAYYRHVKGFLLVYDVTNEKSFVNIRKWNADIELNSTPDVDKIIVANKCDCTEAKGDPWEAHLDVENLSAGVKRSNRDETDSNPKDLRVVSEERGQALAAELGCKFMEVSAKSGHSVNLMH